MQIEPGRYNAFVKGYTVTEGRNGEPQAAIQLEVSAGDRATTMTYFGSFKEGKAREFTVKALLTCGLKGNSPMGDLDIGREVSVTIEEEEYDGKTRTKIKWINPLGGALKAMPQEMAKAKLAGLEGAIMAARAESGQNESDELPF